MRESTSSITNLVPSYARGLNTLLVHDDKISLTYLASLLEQYSFKVTTVDKATKAVSIVCKQQEHFKLVMAKINMPDMDSLSFLNLLLQIDIPIIFISPGGCDDIVWKALVEKGCHFLKEPIHSRDLKYVWQHVHHKRLNPKEIQNANSKDKTLSCGGSIKVHVANEKKNACDETKGNQKEKNPKLSSSQSVKNFGSNNDEVVEELGEKTRQIKNSNGSSGKKIRPNIWTKELHHKFTEALSAIGNENARPKLLLNKMNEPQLTLRQVASHLQYYKMQQKRVPVDRKSGSTSRSRSSNFRRTELTKLSQSQSSQVNLASASSSLGLKGLTASTASLNKNQNQNQFRGDNFLQWTENLCNATFQHEPLMGVANEGNRNLDAVIGNPVTAFSTNQNQSLLQLQKTYGSASFPHEHSTGLVCYGSQNLEAASVNRNQSSCLQLQETHGNTAFPYELPTGLPDYGSQNLHTVVQNHVPAVRVHQNQSLLQPQGEATIPYELPKELANYGSQNVDAFGGNLSQFASANENQSLLQLQEQQNNATFFNNLTTGLANYENQDLYAVVQNCMPAGSMHQNQSLLQPSSNAVFSYDLPTGLPNYGSQNLDVLGNSDPATPMDQNQFIIHQQSSRRNETFQYEFPTGLAHYGGQNLHAAVQNHVPADSVHQNQSILQLLETPGNATFPYGLQTGLVNFGSQNFDALVEYPVPVSSLDHNQCPTDIDILEVLEKELDKNTIFVT